MLLTPASPAVLHSLPLHDALPISQASVPSRRPPAAPGRVRPPAAGAGISSESRRLGRPHLLRQGRQAEREGADRKSTRLNSSHLVISYAVFCLKKKINRDTKLQGM